MNCPAHILLVDDNPMDIELMEFAFEKLHLGDILQFKTNGEEALNYLFGRDEYANRDRHPLPDLILLDLKMPGIDGFEVLRQVKLDPVLKRTPLIILTSSKNDSDLARSYDYGANSYLYKPVSFEGFINLVHKVRDYWLDTNVLPPMEGN